MRKRDLTVLTPKVKNQIKAWLIDEEGDPDYCPFPGPKCYICHVLLPGLPNNVAADNPCPCDYYSREYVIKVAKALIK